MRICAHAGLHVDEAGLGWNNQGLRFPKVTQESEILLALADAVGLLDGITYFSMADTAHLRDLGALKRHAATLQRLYLEHRRVLVGPEVTAHLAAVEALPTGDAPPADAAADAPDDVLENILVLLRSDATGAQQGAELAASLGRVEELIEGCTYDGERNATVAPHLLPPCADCGVTGRRGAGKCRTCDGTGRSAKASGAHLVPLVRALLGAAPRGSEVAARVVGGVRELRFEPQDPNLAWLHHARALVVATLRWDTLRDHVDTLATLPALRELRIAGSAPYVDEASALLGRFPRVSTLEFYGDVPVALFPTLGISSIRAAKVTRPV